MPQPENPGSQGEGKKQQYVVTVDFTDDKGRHWSAGTAFEGDEKAVAKHLAAKQIEARPVPTPTK